MSRFSRAIAKMLDKTNRDAGGEITYTRTGTGSVTLDATFGRAEYLEQNGNGEITKYIARDFIVKVEDLVISSNAITPRRNDSIAVTIEGDAKTYQVIEMNGNAYSIDPHGVMLRIHAKEVG